MIIIEKKLNFNLEHSIFDEIHLPSEQCVFFDIETTGFAPESSFLYLIGCLHYKEDHWYLIQWLSESLKDEKSVISAFLSYISSFQHILHFNGEKFDFLYLKKKCDQYTLPYGWEALISHDLYLMIKPLKNLLALDNLKLKSLELFLGIIREDPFTGGQLIGYFYQWLRTKDTHLMKLLLLHNEEDLKGLINILPLLFYKKLLKNINNDKITVDTTESKLLFYIKHTLPLPKDVDCYGDHINLKITRQAISISIHFISAELKFFFDHYKDYYYLPKEDQAIHKSIATYVDVTFREKAKASNCYIKKRGNFLPLPNKIDLPIFKNSYKDTQNFVLLDDLLAHKSIYKTYVQMIISSLL